MAKPDIINAKTVTPGAMFLVDALGNVISQGNGSYELVAASATAQVLGGTGAVGDFIQNLLIIPTTTSPGAVSIKDGSGSAITIFTGGATSVADLKPFLVTLNAKSLAGAWSITTGANVSVLATGSFSA